ncbi:Cyclic nucleotide-gated cation channel beta-3 [Gossypium arboreum]|uniref:Cyclic nucleotide-gated cation channel beta-3 n=1 Tax=Gossypium arboreum TaxID=29729 RepID=A0A0B0PUT4_GOSAR|nr:Cyclic nucleotide-gated cation channel beta-3 [Gossypium arboreum]
MDKNRPFYKPFFSSNLAYTYDKIFTYTHHNKAPKSCINKSYTYGIISYNQYALRHLK